MASCLQAQVEESAGEGRLEDTGGGAASVCRVSVGVGELEVTGKAQAVDTQGGSDTDNTMEGAESAVNGAVVKSANTAVLTDPEKGDCPENGKAPANEPAVKDSTPVILAPTDVASTEHVALPIITVAPPTPVAESRGCDASNSNGVGVVTYKGTAPSIYLSDGTEQQEEEKAMAEPKVPKRMTMVSEPWPHPPRASHLDKI